MRKLLSFIVILLFAPLIYAGVSVDLLWEDSSNQLTPDDSIYYLNFQGALNAENYGMLPMYHTIVPLSEGDYSSDDFSISLTDQKWEVLPAKVPSVFLGSEFIQPKPLVEHVVTVSRKKYALDITVVPLRSHNGQVERLVSFKINTDYQPSISLKSVKGIQEFKKNSVLASGKWVKIAISETGLYKLSYEDINGMGLDPLSVQIYGNGGEILDWNISNYDYDDLNELAVYLHKGDDGVFNAGDYLLFYAIATDKWTWSTIQNEFVHTQNPYSDEAYYYLTSEQGETKEIVMKEDTVVVVNGEVNSFTDYAYVEPQINNLLESGYNWYGSKMSSGDNQEHRFEFKNVLTDELSKLSVSYAARSTVSNSSVTVSVNNVSQGSLNISNTSASLIGVYAYEKSLSKTFKAISDNIVVDLDFLNSADPSASGWLNYVRVNVKRALTMDGSQLAFRYPDLFGDGLSLKYRVSTTKSSLKVLDVTDRLNNQLIAGQYSNGIYQFTCDASQLREFIAFDPEGSFPKPSIRGVVENQNLHALDPVDMVIVAHPDFIGAGMASDLLELHTDEGLKVIMVTPQEIYNEFSGGQPDITAIRWFLKMIYDRASGEDDLLKYLLLFGDGTFDNRPGEDNNKRNRILTYQSQESLHQANTYVSDDYFGVLDNNEGSLGNGDKVDIGVGRYPVHTIAEAKAMVTKTKYYIQNKNRSMWKNTICFVADDGDNNIHMRDANLMADKVMRNYPDMVVDKILLDAYQQVIEATGPSYPDADKAFVNNLQKGVVLLNYSGHGGTSGLTDEKLVTKNIIANFTNLNSLPVWVTATCEFSRFDLDDETSAGELVLLSAEGGGVALFTTTRVVFSSSNYTINNNFFNYAFEKDANGTPLRLGDICRETKSHTGTGANKRKFMLLGNPALTMTLPSLTVKTSEINGDANFESNNDTISALQGVTVKGFIANEDGDTATSFNGSVYMKVYDKISTISTLQNDAYAYNSGGLDFVLWNKVVFNGKETVKNGLFEFEFMVPKEIQYQIGQGRIVYYATSDNMEAKGYTENIQIGGFNQDFVVDDEGPQIDLFLNSEGFSNGATVSADPLLIANITDMSGINTSGAGVGHDIVMVLDNDPQQTQLLNDFYFPVAGFSEGQVKFKLNDLDEGEHSIFFRVWDIYNNSSSKTITFYVSNNDMPDLGNIYCYPNPANTFVNFEFDHNRPEQVLDVLIDIFSPSGQLVNRLSEKIYSVGNRVEPISWDLTDATGRRVNRGIYFYRVSIIVDGKKSGGKALKLIVN